MPKAQLSYLLAISVLITGCTSFGQRGTPAPVTGIANESGYLTMGEAINALEKGQINNVERSLQRIVQSDKKNRTAQRLLAQLQQSPDERYGSDYFLYTVKEGESLGLLAKRFLGHSLEFWGLAKYNNIDNPLAIQTGQQLKIPQSDRTSSGGNKVNTVSQTTIREINALISAEQFDLALERLALNNLPSIFQSQQYSVQIRQAIFGLESMYQQEADGKKKVRDTLTSLITKSKNPRFKEIASRWLTQLELPKIREEAKQALARNNLDEAYKAVFVLNNMDTQTAEDTLLIEQVSEYLHKRAVMYYRNQDLEQAIHTWDRVLIINPNHEPARVYRERASKLNSQLQRID